MPSILFNGRLVNQSRRCLFRKFHTGQGLLAKPPPTPRFQKPGSSPKENLEKISAAVEPTGAPKPTLPRNFDEVARPARAPQAHAPPRIVDTSSKEYKQAERKWVSVIVALPILFVTSYFLFDRLALGKVPPSLPGTSPKASETADPLPQTNPKSEGAA